MATTEHQTVSTTPQPQPRNGLGISAFILGIVGSVFGLVPILGIPALICGLVGVGLALGALRRLHRHRADNKVMTWFGAGLSVLAVILSIVGIAIVNRTVDDLNNSLNSIGSTPSASAPATSQDTSLPTPSATKPMPAPSPHVAAIGQPVRDGSYVFTVTRITSGIAKLTAPNMSESPTSAHGQFIVAVVTEKNVASSPQQIPFHATLTGADGKTYATDDDPMTMTVAQFEFLGPDYNLALEVNPDTTNKAVFVWDIPKGVQPASAMLFDPNNFGDTSNAVVSVR